MDVKTFIRENTMRTHICTIVCLNIYWACVCHSIVQFYKKSIDNF